MSRTLPACSTHEPLPTPEKAPAGTTPSPKTVPLLRGPSSSLYITKYKGASGRRQRRLRLGLRHPPGRYRRTRREGEGTDLRPRRRPLAVAGAGRGHAVLVDVHRRRFGHPPDGGQPAPGRPGRLRVPGRRGRPSYNAARRTTTTSSAPRPKELRSQRSRAPPSSPSRAPRRRLRGVRGPCTSSCCAISLSTPTSSIRPRRSHRKTTRQRRRPPWGPTTRACRSAPSPRSRRKGSALAKPARNRRSRASAPEPEHSRTAGSGRPSCRAGPVPAPASAQRSWSST